LYTGDVLSVLAGLPEESVHTVVTSPPYWGLRDYGTGQWEGGSAECNHVERTAEEIGLSNTLGPDHYLPSSNAAFQGRSRQYRLVCGKCGARRIDAQIGLESTPEEYVAKMVEVFHAVRRVLRKDGTLWLNLGSSYAGSGKGPSNSLQPDASCIGNMRGMNPLEGTPTEWIPTPPGFKPKDMIPIPWMVAMALQADGWYLRSDIIWAKPNPMPESVTDRPTKAHEYLFLLSKSPRYFYDAEAIREADVGKDHDRLTLDGQAALEPSGGLRKAHGGIRQVENRNGTGRNRRTVWTIATEAYAGCHFATFPRKLVQPCILAGCPEHACPKCGAPWVKEVERETGYEGARRNDDPEKRGTTRGTGWKDGAALAKLPPARILGEHPTCTCGLPAIGGTCLDPFGGSGTTAEVALEYGRRAILIELKPEYVELQKRRLAPVAGRPMLNFSPLIEPDEVREFRESLQRERAAARARGDNPDGQ
jgi:DNA modification methylase